MGLLIDIKGQRFGRLVVVKKGLPAKHGQQAKWVCKCDCGGKRTSGSYDLRSGKTMSCGCLQREVTTKRNLKHGKAYRGRQHPLYPVWSAMHNRCTNPNDKRFKCYGGKGIKIKWKSFEEFFRDMSDGYEAHKKTHKSTTLDRIDNNGDYSKKNCRWVTNKENCNNRYY